MMNVFILAFGPSFTVRKHWRDTLSRLTEFLRLLDYIILELLRRLVKSCVRDCLIHLRASYSVEFRLNSRTPHGDEEEFRFQPLHNKSSFSSLKTSRIQHHPHYHHHRPESFQTHPTLRTNIKSEL